jgi:hypothetical protein
MNAYIHTCVLLPVQRHLPFVGYFAPIGGSANPDTGTHPMDRHLKLVHDTFELKYDIKQVRMWCIGAVRHLVACAHWCAL